MIRHLTDDDFQALLDNSASDQVRTHLQACETCREIWQEVALAHAFLSQAEPVAAPDTLHDRVMAALSRADPAPALMFSRRTRLGLIALLLASGVALSGILMAGLVVVAAQSEQLMFVGRIFVSLLQTVVHVTADLAEMLLILARTLVLGPWAGPLFIFALLMAALSIWMTRFYSRRLYPAR